MKPFLSSILFLSIILTGSNLNAQIPNYLEANTEWSENILFKEGICINQYKTIYYLNGDSTAASHTYQKMYRRGYRLRHPQEGTPGGAATWCAAPVAYFNEFSVLIRQDQKRLYVYHPEYGDTLLYDFDLQPGDTLPSTINDFDMNVVDYVDSVLIGNEYRKVFYLTESSELLVEGVGSEAGLMQFFNFETNTEYFYFAFQYCYRNNHGNLNFSGAEYCNWTMDIAETTLPNLQVFPNPVTNAVQLTSDFSLEEIRKIEIINIFGEIFHTNFHINKSGIEVDMETFSPGLYLIRVNSELGWSSAIKVQKI